MKLQKCKTYATILGIICLAMLAGCDVGYKYNQYGYTKGYYTVRDASGNEWHNMEMCGGGIGYAKFASEDGKTVTVRGDYSYEMTSR